jgi:tetratricopeptide (TPR) repeat protein
MNKFVSNNPLSLWRFLIVSATIFIVAPIAPIAVMALLLPQFSLEIPLLAEIITITYVDGNVKYLVPIFGLLYGYGLWHKRTSTDVARMTPIALPFSIALTIGIFNKALLISTIIGASIVALDASVFDGIMLFIATCVAAGSGAAIKHALIDAAHPSQSLLMIGATAIALLASWLASSSSVAYDGVILLGGYWAPAVGCLIGLTSQIESPAVFISNRNADTFSAAEQGDAGAQFNLGTMYYNGHYGQSVIKDYEQAVKWFRLAAEQGVAEAQTKLGLMYTEGQGVAQDYKEAAKWYRLVAEQGNSFAQFQLGRMYTEGKGVVQDNKEAIKWYRLAAEQGNADAQASLGAMYGLGKD